MKSVSVDRQYVIFDDFFAVLGNKQCVRILQYLNEDGGKCVNEIGEKLGIEQSAVSHGLRRLLICHFVYVKPSGKERVYSINYETVRPLLDLINEHVRRYCVRGCRHWN